jgi:hypothetical protein
VVIGETTFGGLPALAGPPGAIIDYGMLCVALSVSFSGSLIYIALQRSKTAREAISVMTSLVQQYGMLYSLCSDDAHKQDMRVKENHSRLAILRKCGFSK